MQLILTSR